MIVKSNTDATIERHKARLGLKGDVYVIDGKYIESLTSHRRLIPNSTAANIKEAEAERIVYEAELEEQRRKVAEETAQAEAAAAAAVSA